MKRLGRVVVFLLCVFLTSCSNSEAADNMADEMCVAMEKYKVEEPMTMLDAANDMASIKSKKDKYCNVTNGQLKKAMLKKCPEGWKKYEMLKGK